MAFGLDWTSSLGRCTEIISGPLGRRDATVEGFPDFLAPSHWGGWLTRKGYVLASWATLLARTSWAGHQPSQVMLPKDSQDGL
jgi:hypothetical protein